MDFDLAPEQAPCSEHFHLPGLGRRSAKTGEPRDVEVLWRSAHPLSLERDRTRPCGHLISADQSQAVQRLRTLGIAVDTVSAGADQHPRVARADTRWPSGACARQLLCQHEPAIGSTGQRGTGA